MNVLWLSHMVPYPPKGGSLQRSFNLIRQLAARHDVHLLAFNQKAILPTATQVEESRLALSKFCRHVEILESPAEASTFSRNRLLLANLVRSGPYSIDLLATPRMHAAIHRTCNDVAIDLIHCDAVELAQFAFSTPPVRRALNHHNVESLLLQRRSERVGNPAERFYFQLQSRKLRKYEASVMPRFDLNVSVSEPDRDDLLAIAPQAKVEVVPNGVDLEYFRNPGTPIRAGELVFMGGMTWFPNRDAVTFFIESVWPRIQAELPSAHLTLIGRRPEAIASLTGDPQISSLGFVDDIRQHVAQAEVVIIPIRVGGGTRLKILDAFACGKAIVTTRVGCEGLAVTDGVHLLMADRAEDFAGAVLRVCRDPELRDTLGRNARRLAEEKYSWDSIGAGLNRHYERLVNGKAA